MKFIATGDTIVTCPYTRNYRGYKELAEFIRTFDVRMNNMENPLVDGPCETSAFSGIPWMAAPTSLLDEMADFGFNCHGGGVPIWPAALPMVQRWNSKTVCLNLQKNNKAPAVCFKQTAGAL